MFRYIFACLMIAGGAFYGFVYIHSNHQRFIINDIRPGRTRHHESRPSPRPTYLVSPRIHVFNPWPSFEDGGGSGGDFAVNYPILGGGLPNVYRRQAPAACPTGTTTCGSSGSCCTADQNCWVQNNGECANKGSCPGSHPTLCHNMTADPQGQNSNEFYCCSPNYVCTPNGCDPPASSSPPPEPVTITVKQISFVTPTPTPTPTETSTDTEGVSSTAATTESTPTQTGNGTASDSQQKSGTGGGGSGKPNHLAAIIGGAVGGVVLAIIIAGFIYWWRTRQPHPPPPVYNDDSGPGYGYNAEGIVAKPELPTTTASYHSTPTSYQHPNADGAIWAKASPSPHRPRTPAGDCYGYGSPPNTGRQGSFGTVGPNTYGLTTSFGATYSALPAGSFEELPSSPNSLRPRGGGGMASYSTFGAIPVQEHVAPLGDDGRHELDPQQAEYLSRHELAGRG